MLKPVIGVLLVAAVATGGDAFWYEMGVRHRMTAGALHGALLLGAVGLVLGWISGRLLQGLVAGQGEFSFGVPQFSQLFHPVLVCLAAGLALVTSRLVHGRWWTVGVAVCSFVLMSGVGDGDAEVVETRQGGTFVVSAVLVELVALQH